MRSFFVTIAVVFLCTLQCFIAQAAVTPTISSGTDWSFPDTTQKSSKGGYFQMGGVSPTVSIPSDLDDLLNCYGVTFTWADLNPAENSYDFSYVSTALSVAQQNGKCLVARLKNHIVARQTEWGSNGPFIPQWVLDKHSPTTFYTYGDASSTYFLRVAAPWDSGVQQEYLKFVAAAGANGFLSHSSLKGLYVHGISGSAGEEMWLDEEGAQNAVAAGMTQNNIQTYYGARFQAWKQAAGSMVHKLAWVGANAFSLPEDDYYRESRVYLNTLAATLGMGIRSGGNEEYNNAFSEQWGLAYDETTQKLTIDPDWAYRDYNRYIGGEDEQYADQTMYDLAFASTIWVEALIGATHIWLPEPSLNNFIRRNRAILDWYAYRAGLPLAQAPDAAIWLRESYFSDGVDCNTVMNFELGLIQLSGPGKNTVQTDLYDRGSIAGGDFPHDCSDKQYDYLSRRTDVASGNDEIAIQIEDSFKQSLGSLVAIKVIYQDNSSAAWHLETPAITSDTIQNSNDGQMKTATFTFSTTNLASSFSDGAHFKLIVSNNDNLKVRFIRLVKLNAQTGDIDHDGTVGLKDTMLALQILSGATPTTPVYPSSSVNGTTISIGDAIYGLRKTAYLE